MGGLEMKTRYKKWLSAMLFPVAFAMGFFGYNIFFPDVHPEMAQKTQQSFVAALIANKTPLTEKLPAPRIIKFQNAKGYTTWKIITIRDYQLSKTEGCIFYNYAFSNKQEKVCFPKTDINFDAMQPDLHTPDQE
jgi:hypothetical protein